MDNPAFLLALHKVSGLGPIKLKALLDYYKDPKLAWEAMKMPKKLDPHGYLKSLEQSGIKWMSIFDDSYPKLLKEIYDPPVILYYKGEILSEDSRAIGVVGTRHINSYGRAVTEKLVRELVSSGVTIVSGLAKGVDFVAHQTAIRSGGRTLAVLGSGLNYIFPPENTGLAEEIAAGFGAVLSEYPPDQPPLAGNFPVRNRIISGLSQALLVTQAAQGSGSQITARAALEQGRDVFAVPGPIFSELSWGPHMLIKEGACLVTCGEEILRELDQFNTRSRNG